MSHFDRDSISSLLNDLFREFGKESNVDSLLRLSNRYVKSFANSQIPSEEGVVSSLQTICRQRLMNGEPQIEKLNSIYSKLKKSKETNPQTRQWMLYLLLTLKYQNKSVSIQNFSIPKLPTHSPYATPRKSFSRKSTPQKTPISLNLESTINEQENNTSLTLPIAESLLIRDIIVTFQGIDSTYFRYDNASSMYIVSDDLHLPLHILNTVLHLLQIGSLYKRIRLMMNETKSEEHGIIRNSVNDNVNKQLYQFYRFVISLEEKNNQSISNTNETPLTLQQLVFQCEGPLQRLTYLYNILCCSINLRGGALASSIYNFTNHGDNDYRSLSLSLLEDINKFILKQSWEWAVNGRLLDIHAEFFVEIAIPPSYFNPTLPKQEFNQWSDTYHKRNRMIPIFFPSQLVDSIFRCGKSIHFIRDTLQDSKWCLHDVDISILSQCSLNHYKPFETVLQSVYKQAQSHIIEVYKQKYHLFQMLSLLQQFYLLGAGDFYLEFISCVEDTFITNRDEISDGWFQEVFSHCVNNTSLASTSDYIAQHLHLNRLHHLSVFDIWKTPFFTIDKEPNLAVIFTQSVMAKYELIFGFLMNLRTQSLILERIWTDQCWLEKELDRLMDSSLRNQLRQVLDQFNLLRVKIHSFLTTLQSFYYLHIIDKLYKKMIMKIQEVEEFDGIIECHKEFIDSLSHFVFVDSSETVINQQIVELVALSKKFVGIQNKLFDSIHTLLDKLNISNKITDELKDIEQNRKQEISELDVLFIQKMQSLIMQLRDPPKGYADFITIASQLDFNYFYTEP